MLERSPRTSRILSYFVTFPATLPRTRILIQEFLTDYSALCRPTFARWRLSRRFELPFYRATGPAMWFDVPDDYFSFSIRCYVAVETL